MIILKNYLKVLFRNLWKNKFSTFLNMLGLAIGMTGYLLIFQYVNFELSYDRFHKNLDDIYRLQRDVYEDNGRVNRWAINCYSVGEVMKEEFPEIKEISRSFSFNTNIVRIGERVFRNEKILVTEPSFFKIFSYPVLQGNPVTGLEGPNKIMLSESTARKFFGHQDPIGQKLQISSQLNEGILMVTGIFKDIPANSHIKFDSVLSLNTVFPRNYMDWISSVVFTHLLLTPNANVKALEAKFPAFIKKHILTTVPRAANWIYRLQRLQDIYLYSNLTFDTKNGNGMIVYFLLIIAFLILAVSWINYVNLAAAQALERSKEVGIRKVLGSSRWQLIRQFLNESILANIIPITISVILCVIFLPYLSQLTGKQIVFSLSDWRFWLHIVILYIMGSLLSGLYPAFILSSFPSINAIKRSKFNQTPGGRVLKKGLVTFQFTAALVLIILTFTVYKQIRFMTHKDPAINTDHLLAIELPPIPFNKDNTRIIDSLKTELLRYPGIKSVSGSLAIPGASAPNRLLAWKENTEYKNGKILPLIFVDHEFLPIYQVRFLIGRNFSREYGTDTQAVILNEAAVAELAYENPGTALNQKILLWNMPGTYKIIGVIKNYHQFSLKRNYEPLIFALNTLYKRFYSIKLKPVNTDINKTITLITKKWEEIFPGYPTDYFFLDDYFNRQYREDYQLGSVIGSFMVLVVIITCLGLLGLSYFNTSQRKKEIAIRKSIGASIGDVLGLLTKDIVKLVIIAAVAAWPIAYLIIDYWLKSYAFRIAVPLLFFIFSGLLLVIITLVTVAYHTMAAARANPVDALREE